MRPTTTPERSAGPRLHVVADADALHEAAAAVFVRCAARAQADGRDFVVALSGGSTPRGLYRLLARDPWRARVDWSRVVVCQGDERAVPADHADSNFRMAREALLDHVPVAPERVLRIETEHDASEAAARYERSLRVLFGTPDGAPSEEPGRSFDLVLLGLGDDGHTASLFPNSPTLARRDVWVADTDAPTAGPRRITLTYPLLDAAAARLLLVEGARKREALRATLSDVRDPTRWPVQGIEVRRGDFDVLADAAAC